MPTQPQNIRKKIINSTTFDELYSALILYPNWLIYAEDVTERIQNLPIEIHSDLIWMLCKSGYAPVAKDDDSTPDTYRSLLEMYCNRIISEGLLNSDTTATWDTLVSKFGGTSVAPIIIASTTVDLSKVDIKYLLETAHAITSYEYFDSEVINWEDNMNLIRDIFSGTKPLHDVIEKTNTQGMRTEIHDIAVAVFNVIKNADAKYDFILTQLKSYNEDMTAYRIETVASTIYDQHRQYFNDLELDDIKTFLTYIMASVSRIVTKWLAAGKTASDVWISNNIIREFVISAETVKDQIPDTVDPTDKYHLLSSIMMQGIYLTDACGIIYKEVKEALFPIILQIYYNDGGVLCYPKEYSLIIPPNAAFEAKSIRDQEYDDDENDDESEDEDSDEDSDNEDDDSERDYDDSDARRYNRGNHAKQTKSGYAKSSGVINRAGQKIYRGYRAYKDVEAKVDSQVSKLTMAVKNKYRQGIRDEIVEGKQFSVIKILKKIFTTAAVFSYNKIAGLLFVVVRAFTHNKVSNKERYEIMQELQLEIKMLEEKIEDARGDGNRQAKYSMMRTKAELEKAYNQIRYGMHSNRSAKAIANKLTRGKLNTDYRGGGGGEY